MFASVTGWMRKMFSNIYFNESPLSERDLEKSRTLSIFEGSTARTVGTLTAGAFLAGLVKYLGGDDRINGVIAAIPTLSGAVMLFTPLFFEGISRRKFYISFGAFLSRILLSLTILIPLLLLHSSLSRVSLVLLYLVANLIVSFVNPPASAWQISYTSERSRGRYFGIRESYVLGFATLTTLLMGRILDHFKKINHESEGFMILFMAVFILAIVNFVFASGISEPKILLNTKRITLKELVLLPLENGKFRRIVLMMILWNIGFQISAPFTAVYMVSGLGLNYTYISVTGILAAVASVASARLLGRVADRKSWFYLLAICMGFQASSQMIWFFVNKDTAYLLIPLAQLLGGAALGGVNISLSNIQYKYAPDNRKTLYIGFSSAAGGLIGFLSSLAGSGLMGSMQSFNIKIAGFNAGNMQILFGISGFLLILCIVFTKSLNIWDSKNGAVE